MISRHSQPFYLIDKGHPAVEAWRTAFDTALCKDVKALYINVDPEAVDKGDVSMAEEMLGALQHYRNYIEPMAGLVKFNFRKEAGRDEFIAGEVWKREAKYLRWFRAMHKFSYISFFTADRDVQLYILAGDYLAKGSTSIIPPQGDATRVRVTGLAVKELCKRMFEMCVTFMLYCHGSAVSTRPMVEKMTAQYTMPVHFIDIFKEYQRDTKNYSGFFVKRAA